MLLEFWVFWVFWLFLEFIIANWCILSATLSSSKLAISLPLLYILIVGKPEITGLSVKWSIWLLSISAILIAESLVLLLCTFILLITFCHSGFIVLQWPHQLA